MTADDLRTRIVTAIWDELDRQREPGFGPFVDRESGAIDTEGSDGVDMAAVADAVIRELCLHREDMNEWAVLANGFRGHRYVTHWEENEPAPVVRIRSAEKLGLTGDGE